MHLRSFVSPMAALVVGAAVSLVHATPSFAEAGMSISTRQLTFRSQVQNNTNLRYIANSGICETTPGVTQYSGYIDVGTNMSMWFWFFESRSSPETAPFTLWLNGGPGCSSMIGLFQENGPCGVNEGGTSTYINPYSWNNVSNMIYIDQPIGTGFSYGRDTVTSTEAAAPLVWIAFQILFESQLFSTYASRELIFATESYGGHYGPSFVTYFDQQNALIASGTIKGEHIVVSALMINNGWYDPLIQNIAYYVFASNAPGYGPLQSDAVLKNIYEALYSTNGCVEQQENCYKAGYSTGSNEICHEADTYCINNVSTPAIGNLDPDDLRQNSSASFPPEYYVDYLKLPEVVSAIGAESPYQECPNAPYELIVGTGDDARSWLPQLSELANSGLKILTWAGDTDINCNWLGVYASMLAMHWNGNETLHNTPLTNITLDGIPIAAVANVGNFSFARVYAAGHEVSAFQPAVAVEIFDQIINKQPLHSV